MGMLRVDPVADREKGLRSAARDADCASWLRPEKKIKPATANTRPSSMSSLFLTELPPISLCAHHLVLTFRTTAGYYTHVSELSS